MTSNRIIRIGEVELALNDGLVRTVRLKDEFYVPAPDPVEFVAQLRSAHVRADLYSFVQNLHERTRQFDYRQEAEPMAVLPLTTFDDWINKQIRAKSRNMLRKAQRCGVETRVVELSDELLHGIKKIYDETPIRQGKRNWHYRKGIDTLRCEHATFLDRSEFVGAFHLDELIGFAKVVHSPHCSIIMNLVSSLEHRDKAPSNALIAKIIERVTAKGIGLLNYAAWGRRGMNAFKVASAFERVDIPRYYVALNARGRCFVKLGLHRPFKNQLPEPWLVEAARLRDRWMQWRFQVPSRSGRSADEAHSEHADPEDAVLSARPRTTRG